MKYLIDKSIRRGLSPLFISYQIHFLRGPQQFTKIQAMTKEDFFYMIEVHKELEFSYKGKTYQLSYDKNNDGEYKIIFGQLYEGKKYDSLGEFLNTAKVENSYFKDLLDIL